MSIIQVLRMIQPTIMKGKQQLIKDNHVITQTGQCHSFCCNCTPVIEVNCAILIIYKIMIVIAIIYILVYV